MIENLTKLSHYVDGVVLTKDCWVSTPDENCFIHADLEAFSEFEGKPIINIKDFLQKINLFVKRPKEDIPFIDADIEIMDDFAFIKKGHKQLKYPFSSLNIGNEKISDGEGNEYTVATVIKPKIEKLLKDKTVKLKLHSDAYKELLKLKGMFSNISNSFNLSMKDGNLFFYVATDSGSDYKTKLTEDTFDDFENFTYDITYIPHVDDWEITFFNGKPLMLWESLTSDFKILMILG